MARIAGLEEYFCKCYGSSRGYFKRLSMFVVERSRMTESSDRSEAIRHACMLSSELKKSQCVSVPKGLVISKRSSFVSRHDKMKNHKSRLLQFCKRLEDDSSYF